MQFKGTTRDASLPCHNYNEKGPKDDIESWIFMVWELIVSWKHLYWHYATDLNMVAKMKKEFLDGPTRFLFPEPPENVSLGDFKFLMA